MSLILYFTLLFIVATTCCLTLHSQVSTHSTHENTDSCPYYFCDIGAHANFLNPTTTPSGVKVRRVVQSGYFVSCESGYIAGSVCLYMEVESGYIAG